MRGSRRESQEGCTRELTTSVRNSGSMPLRPWENCSGNLRIALLRVRRHLSQDLRAGVNISIFQVALHGGSEAETGAQVTGL